MTLEEIKASDKTVLTPGDIAEVLHVDAQDVRIAAKLHPERLGFPVCVIGSRTKIPRLPFLKYFGIDI